MQKKTTRLSEMQKESGSKSVVPRVKFDYTKSVRRLPELSVECKRYIQTLETRSTR